MKSTDPPDISKKCRFIDTFWGYVDEIDGTTRYIEKMSFYRHVLGICR